MVQSLSILSRFYEMIVCDARIGPAHISLYLALFQYWRLRGFQNPVAFTSKEIMPMAKIGSRATYHKVLKDLVECGYIGYVPSSSPLLKSLAYLH